MVFIFILHRHSDGFLFYSERVFFRPRVFAFIRTVWFLYLDYYAVKVFDERFPKYVLKYLSKGKL